VLYVENLYFSYSGKKILRGVNFSVEEGEIVALIGISGSGKTTLFKLIAGLLPPLSGTIHFRGIVSADCGIFTTYMRQEDLLLPWRTVMGNLLLFSELGKEPIKKPAAEASALLKRLGLAGYENVYPNELSGGMRQRVSLARALLQNRPLFLLDEPFASLDVILREQLYQLLREIRIQYKKTIIMVTHDFRDAIALADRILILSQGRISNAYEIKKPGYPIETEQLMHQIRNDLLAIA
jgi:NitT/TauT family transport system ATP-binding protein